MPAIDEKLFIETSSKYQRGVALDNYNGVVSLVQAGRGNDKIWADWCYPQKRESGENVPGPKAVPWGVRLGDKAQSIAVLKKFLAILERGETSEPADYQYPQDDLDIAF